MKTYRRIIVVVGVFVCGVAAFAFAQMMPYMPPASGTGAGGGSIGGTTPPDMTGSGASTGSDSVGSSAQPVSPDDEDPYVGGDSYAGSEFASDFQDQLDVIAKKPKKPKKAYLGISTLWQDPRGDIQRMVFGGSALGANWRIGGTASDPVAQGTLTGKGSVWNIVVGLYTGFVRSTLISKASNWTALFYSEQSSQRSDFFNGKIIYQEELAMDAEGAARKLALLLNGTTLFGSYEDGSFFIVDADALPDAIPLGAVVLSIPRMDGPAIPTQKIIELLGSVRTAMRTIFVAVAHAAIKSLTPAQVFDRLVAYKKIVSTMQGVQQQFAAFDFNDPNLDYDAVQELIDAYDIEQKKLDYLVTQLGRARLFVRGGDWLLTGGSAAYALMDEGVGILPATLVSHISGPFDFYVVKESPDPSMNFGTCTGKNDIITGEEVACVLRRPTAAQSKAVLKANEEYLLRVREAHAALGAIESALFAPAE